MSARDHNARRLPEIAPAMLASLYQHRLLSTRQLHELHTSEFAIGWARRILALLRGRGLVDRVQVPRTRSLWFLTEQGADAVETAGPRAEPRRRVTTPAQAEGQLRAHTLAVNDVGIAFVKAARARPGDECASESWRHEIAHPITARRGRRPAELVIADALLTYLQADAGKVRLHQRFIELDRGTARPAEQLASKITRYARLRTYTPTTDGRPLWRSHYRSFPGLLVVFADQSPERIRLRIERTLKLYESDPARAGAGGVRLSFVALDQLISRGPFAPIFTNAEKPGQPVDWLGTTPTEQPPPDFRKDARAPQLGEEKDAPPT